MKHGLLNLGRFYWYKTNSIIDPDEDSGMQEKSLYLYNYEQMMCAEPDIYIKTNRFITNHQQSTLKNNNL